MAVNTGGPIRGSEAAQRGALLQSAGRFIG